MRALSLVLAGALAVSRAFAQAAPAAARQAPAMAVGQDWTARAALYEVFVQDFSQRGDFRGVIDGLPRIEATGANTLWIMPVHPIGVEGRKGELGSPYAAKDFRRINPALGSGDDFRALVDAAHRRGMKVILDWVPDHTAPDHPWITQHPDWYVHDAHGQPSVPLDNDGKPTDWTDVRQLDYRNPALRAEMIATMQYWIDSMHLDGFRCDVAGFVPATFWREAIGSLRQHTNRPLLFLAEWGDLAMHRVGFDLTYAWDSYRRLKSVFRGATADSFITPEIADLRQMPTGGARMRFTTNHDETAWDNPPVAIFGGSAGARAAYVAMAMLPGRPLLYNGQEIESPQKLRLFYRDTIQWRQADTTGARAFYHRVIQLVTSDESLLADGIMPVRTSARADVIAYRRGRIVVLVNPRNHPVHFTVTGFVTDGAHEMLTDRVYRGRQVELPAYGALVLKR